MTKEEIKQEAEEQVNVCTPYHTGSFIQGYIAAVESWQAKYEKQKEINKELVDENHKLADCNARLLDQVGAATKRTIELEKENAELKKKCYKKAVKDYCELEKENAELRAKYLQATDEGTSFAHLKSLERENTKLKEQIEKMKCCFNCKHSRTEYEHCRTDKHEKWEIKENDRT